MRTKLKNDGSVLLVTVFAIVLLTTFVVGMLEMNSEQIQIMKNEIFTAQARAIAEAGIADALSQIRSTRNWSDGFSNKSFGGGSYTVSVTGTLPAISVISTGTSAQNFTSKVEADITIASTSPYTIRINKLKVNQ
jgi:Tfp pilus assembly protein PilX